VVNVGAAFIEAEAVRNLRNQERHSVPQGTDVRCGVELPQNGMGERTMLEFGDVPQIPDDVFNEIRFGIILNRRADPPALLFRLRRRRGKAGHPVLAACR